VPALVCAGAQLCEQPRLADPRRTDDLDRARPAAGEAVERVVELLELGAAAYEGVGELVDRGTSARLYGR